MGKKKPKYLKKILQRISSKQLVPGTISMIRVYHDDWCAIYKGNPCNCNPDIDMGELQGKN